MILFQAQRRGPAQLGGTFPLRLTHQAQRRSGAAGKSTSGQTMQQKLTPRIGTGPGTSTGTPPIIRRTHQLLRRARPLDRSPMGSPPLAEAERETFRGLVLADLSPASALPRRASDKRVYGGS